MDPLDPEIRRYLDEVLASASRHPDPSTLPIEEARRIMKALRMRWASDGPEMAVTATHQIPTHRRDVPVRFYYPHSERPLPGLVYLHGGGWTLFDLDTHDRVMREYAARADVVVAGIDFARAPETPFPGQIEECVAVIAWLAREGKAWGIDPNRLAIGGDSAGANIALATLLTLRDSGKPLLQAGVLNYGVYDCDLDRPSYRAFGDGSYVLSTERMAWFWSNYVSEPNDRSHPLASPLRAELQGLPPLFLVISACDILYDENLAMAHRLREAGVEVETRTYPGTIHAFLEAVAVAGVAGRAFDDGAAWLRHHFDSRIDGSGET